MRIGQTAAPSFVPAEVDVEVTYFGQVVGKSRRSPKDDIHHALFPAETDQF
jgi:hypothetical protein